MLTNCLFNRYSRNLILLQQPEMNICSDFRLEIIE